MWQYPLAVLPTSWAPSLFGSQCRLWLTATSGKVICKRLYTKSPRHRMMSGTCIRKWQLPTLPPGGAVPSAMVSLTSLCGMGRGGSSPL